MSTIWFDETVKYETQISVVTDVIVNTAVVDYDAVVTVAAAAAAATTTTTTTTTTSATSAAADVAFAYNDKIIKRILINKIDK